MTNQMKNPTRLKDIHKGTKIGKLTVTDFHYKGSSKIAKVRCECGNEKDVRVCNMASGRTLSCGCLRSQNLSNLNFDRWEEDPNNDRVGEIHGWLLVTKRDYDKPKRTNIFWICRCKCGRDISVASYQFNRRNGIMSCRQCYPNFIKKGNPMKLKTFYFAEKPVRFVSDETGIWVVVDDFKPCTRMMLTSQEIITKIEMEIGAVHISKKSLLSKSFVLDCFSMDAVEHLISQMNQKAGNNLRKWVKSAVKLIKTPKPQKPKP